MEEEEIYAWGALLAIFIIPLASMAPRILRKVIKNKEGNLSRQTIIQEKNNFKQVIVTINIHKNPKQNLPLSFLQKTSLS